MVELMIVVAISAVLAGSAIAIATTAAKRSRVDAEMEKLLNDVAGQRATHVAEGRNELLLICNDCVDGSGNDNGSPEAGVVDFYLGDDPGDRKHGSVVGSFNYELVVTFDCNRGALDALGRSILLGAGDALPTPDGRVPAVPGDCKVTLQPVGDSAKESMVLGADGRINSTFAPPLLPAPPHARNLSSRTTPNPMDRGRFEGDTSRALAIPLR